MVSRYAPLRALRLSKPREEHGELDRLRVGQVVEVSAAVGDFPETGVLYSEKFFSKAREPRRVLMFHVGPDCACELSAPFDEIEGCELGLGLAQAAGIVAGYDEIRPLDLAEQQVLFPLILARLATSACIAMVRGAANPDHATWFSHLHSTWDALMVLADMVPREAEIALCSGCRVHRGATPVASLLEDRREKSLPGVLSLS